MSSEKVIYDVLKDFEKRISALESLIGNSKKSKVKASKTSLSNHILQLRDNRFLSQPKTADEIHKKLQGTYHCELNRVEVSLIRLADRKKLRKASKLLKFPRFTRQENMVGLNLGELSQGLKYLPPWLRDLQSENPIRNDAKTRQEPEVKR